MSSRIPRLNTETFFQKIKTTVKASRQVHKLLRVGNAGEVRSTTQTGGREDFPVEDTRNPGELSSGTFCKFSGPQGLLRGK